MKPDIFFSPRPESKPAICGCEDTNPQYWGLLKVGYPHFTPPATDRKPLSEIMRWKISRNHGSRTCNREGVKTEVDLKHKTDFGGAQHQ